jgi:anti-sigma regulatory factor (Ser/Thr protein kinase)
MLARCFRISARISEVDPLILRLMAAVEPMISAERLLSLELAAIEALTNVVLHGCAGQPDAIIQVELSANPDGLSLLISDPGVPMKDGLFENALDLDQIDPSSESGRGLATIKACADVVVYTRKADRNSLTLTFRSGRNP